MTPDGEIEVGDKVQFMRDGELAEGVFRVLRIDGKILELDGTPPEGVIAGDRIVPYGWTAPE